MLMGLQVITLINVDVLPKQLLIKFPHPVNEMGIVFRGRNGFRCL